MLEAEIDLLKFTFPQANQFYNNTQSDISKVYFIPKSDGLGIDSMGEFVSSFELSNQFINKEGKTAPFIHISKALESAFNFSFGDAYKSKNRIFNRKPYNLTKSLDYLKNLIIRASRKKKMKKDLFVNILISVF
ncbi:hypothetical protein [Dysgonomonas capnocytophagoides]|uniref:hypothetical protein n=1 Tax=Dysgonomonas capnocytophagoides TaxID=45254 RepID=UPI00291EAF7A|nr:hypothetical protein DCPSUM001_29420 [Dysgonomonas capnocytophagoides]